MNWASLLLPLGIEILKQYIKNTDSSKDDKVLDVVKDSCRYLEPKDNNTLSSYTRAKVDGLEMISEEEK